ncbi:MAG: zinc ribbon domain-containing protein, partial [Caldilineaceae bacterium]
MSPELINNIATLAGVLVAGLGAFIFAFWVAMGIWAFNDIRSRTRDWLAILLAVLLVMVFPIVGLILYTLIRPKSTLADTYDRALEEEALLRELEETQACQTCGVPVKENWIFCPNCHGQLQHTCPSCTNLVRNDWAICVYCGTSQRAAQARELGQREMQPSYQPAYQSSAARPTLEGQATPALGPTLAGGAAMSSSMGTLQPAPVQRRPMRNPFAPTTAMGIS